MSVDYSVIVPAYNEEAFLPKTLEALQKAMSCENLRGEIIVVDNNSTDTTAASAKQFNTRLIFEPINQISRARNAGAREAQGRYLIFLDADTTVSTDLLKAALENLETKCCCGGGVLVGLDGKLTTSLQKGLDFWNWLSKKFNLAAGCFIYCLRDGFEKTGGFSEQVYASEEIWFSRQLAAWGKRYGLEFRIITELAITTSMRKIHWYSPVQLIMMGAPILIFPPAVFFKGLCAHWYSRPK